ncbi:MAG: glycerophosphodiester phosphodiesterase [Anaerolineae bacterium]|nr:glycerophosphodiester phosphodiesterase [Anaerolineae bacterium]
MTSLTDQVAHLRFVSTDTPDRALALAHVPVIRFDVREPFQPLAVGYTVFRANGTSPSFPRDIVLDGRGAVCIEYAIWWDWDIQHLYELEHIWVFLDADGRLADADASWHGGYSRMIDEHGALPAEDGRLVVCSEPGKHAFAPSPAWLIERKPHTVRSCTSRSGAGGVWVTPLFEGVIHDRNPNTNQLVRTYLERHAFEPTHQFDLRFALEKAICVPWDTLNAWIPPRVTAWLDELERTIPPHERRVLRIAHRGASAHAQENSADAIRIAAELGSDLVEVDVRVTADGVPVISHDDSLNRVYGVPGRIPELTLEQLQAAAPVMTFDQLLEQSREVGIGLYLDIKALTPAAAARMFSAVDRTGMKSAVIFASFSVDTVTEIKANRPDVVTSILFGSTHVDPVALAQATGADVVHPCWERVSDDPSTLLTPEWLARVRAAKLGVVTWHEERPPVIASLKRLGVTGICSDNPELLV